jgi:hypothetical protein
MIIRIWNTGIDTSDPVDKYSIEALMDFIYEAGMQCGYDNGSLPPDVSEFIEDVKAEIKERVYPSEART